MRRSERPDKATSGAQQPERARDSAVPERAADQWSDRLRRWAEKHYGHLPKARRLDPMAKLEWDSSYSYKAERTRD
jgi:hypothetical protein